MQSVRIVPAFDEVEDAEAGHRRGRPGRRDGPTTGVAHMESDVAENLEVFAVDDADELEATMDEMREAPSSDVITHMYTLDDTHGSAVIPTDTMTVQFTPDVGPDVRADILAEHGLEVVEDLDFLSHGYTVRLTDASTENPLKIAAKLQARDDIEAAGPDLSFKISLKYPPPDPPYPNQWHLQNRGDQTSLAAGADVNAEGACVIHARLAGGYRLHHARTVTARISTSQYSEPTACLYHETRPFN